MLKRCWPIVLLDLEQAHYHQSLRRLFLRETLGLSSELDHSVISLSQHYLIYDTDLTMSQPYLRGLSSDAKGNHEFAHKTLM